jgi:membrane-associated protein
METLQQVIDWVLHIDRHLDWVIREYGTQTYLVLFAIIFAETGLIFTPFLPGDSLLFAIGAIAARGDLNLWILLASLMLAGVVGNTVNYWVGHYLGPRLARTGKLPLINQRNLDKTHAFFERHGGKAVVLARFVPIVRTFAPFVAGLGAMNHARFQLYNWVGTVTWVGLCTLAGYFFGNIPIVKENFPLVVLGIVIVSLLPMAVEFIRHRRSIRRGSHAPAEADGPA